MIVDQSQANLVTPVVKAIFSVPRKRLCEPERIDLSDPDANDRIVARDSAEPWGLISIDDHWRLTPT